MPCVKKVFFRPLLSKHHSALLEPLSAIKVTDAINELKLLFKMIGKKA